jgi:hypothetical protein
MKTYRVATIPCDGIGKEVIPQPDSQSSKRWPLSENSFTFECRAAVKSRNRDCLFSIPFRDLTAQSLQLKPGLLHLNPR